MIAAGNDKAVFHLSIPSDVEPLEEEETSAVNNKTSSRGFARLNGRDVLPVRSGFLLPEKPNEIHARAPSTSSSHVDVFVADTTNVVGLYSLLD